MRSSMPYLLSLTVLTVCPVAWNAPANARDPCGHAFTITGTELYKEHCASCHGLTGKGDEAAANRHKPPTDLTTIKKRNNGQFPAERVSEIIRYGGGIPSHGEGAEMPIWGKVFGGECGPAYSRRAVVELKRYLESLQN